MIRGVGASSGIAMGKAYVLPDPEWNLPDKLIDVDDRAFEFERLYDGIRQSKSELELIKHEITELVGQEESYIFDAHLAILDDPIFMNEIQTMIQRQSKSAEAAVKEVIDKFVNMFDLLDDDYMKERALDIKDVGNRLLKHLLGATDMSFPSMDQPFILVAKEISPSQLVHLERSHLLGMVTMVGGTTSHTAIMARAMGIPLVMGLEGKLDKAIQSGEELILDGEEGLVILSPTPDQILLYNDRKHIWKQRQEKLQTVAGIEPVTKDGITLNITANISTLKELEQALKNGARGVGLFRTEFIYMDRSTLPSEEEQFEVYKKAAESLKGKPLVIRTLDIGGEKQLDYLTLPIEENPSLGYRAIRVSLDQTELFKTQLKALLRASYYGRVKILYPMISSLEELYKANAILQTAKDELDAKMIPYRKDIEVGIMIEVPAAAIIADQLAQQVDFFSIGTNDLVQYVLAVDRMNESVAQLYNPFQPSIIKLLKYTIDSAHEAGIAVSICGELAGDPKALPIWLGLGLKEISMSPHTILQVKERLISIEGRKCGPMLDTILKCRTSAEILAILEN